MNDEDEWLGVAVHHRVPYLIRGVLAEFILDYQAYDPEFSTSASATTFRGGVLTVTADVALQFLRALKARSLSREEARVLVHSSNAPELLVFIDFDLKRFVHSYYDLALEDYIPTGWRGSLGDPRYALKNWYSQWISTNQV